MPAIEQPFAGETPLPMMSLKTCDVDDQADILAGWSQRYHQLSPGKFDGQIDLLDLQDSQVFFESNNQRIHQTGAPPRGKVVLALPMDTVEEGWFAGRPLQTNSAVLLSAENEFSLRTPLAMVVGAVVIDACLLAEAAADLNMQMALRSLLLTGTAQFLPNGPVQALRNGLNSLRMAVRSGQSWLHNHNAQRTILSTLICQWLGAISTIQPDAMKLPQSRQQRHKVAVDAQHYIREHLAELPTALDLCRHVNVHERVLQYCFQDVFGVTPTAFIKNLRLHEVRRELRADTEHAKTIGDVAARWGFWHPSRFAAEYRQLFGEKPSETHRYS